MHVCVRGPRFISVISQGDFSLFLWFSAVLRGAGQILEESDSDICSDVGTVLADQNDLGKDDSES